MSVQKPELRQGLAAILAVGIHGQWNIFRLFQRGAFQGQSAIRFEEDFAEPKGSVGGDAEGGAGFV